MASYSCRESIHSRSTFLAEQIADHAKAQTEIGVQKAGRRQLIALGLDVLPEDMQELDVGSKVLLLDPFADRPDDVPAARAGEPAS